MSKQNWLKRGALVLPLSCVGFLSTPAAFAQQVVNNSGTPVAGLLVGDINVSPTSPEAATGLAIENLCAQLAFSGRQNNRNQTDLLGRCSDLTFDTTPQTGNLRQVASEEMATQETDIVELSTGQLGAVSARLAGLRSSIQSSAQQVSFNQTGSGTVAFKLNGSGIGGGAGDGIADSGRLGIYVNGEIATGDKDQTANESGFDIDATTITLGADYRVSQGGFVGGALGINNSESDMTNNGGSVESDGVSLMAYGTKSISNSMYIDGTVGIGQYDYDTQRNLNYVASGTPVNQQALATTEADLTFASVGVGRDSGYGADRGMSLSFTGRLNYLDADVDGFTERMSNQNASGFGMNLEIDAQQIESLTSVLGVQLSKAISTSSGVLLPYIGLNYIHEFEDDPRVILARFANDPFSGGFNQSNGTFLGGAPAVANGQSVPTIISITTDAPDANYFRLSAGTTGILPGGKNWFVALVTVIGLEDTSYSSVTAGFRGEF